MKDGSPAKAAESDEVRLVRSNAGKDKDPAFKEPRVPLDSGSTVGTNLQIPPIDEVLGRVLTGEVRSADQKRIDDFFGDTVEKQL
ncbi:hypothetical protein ACOSP7_016585 [Xanthoceras sorbifolium]